jgi:acyl carrier protein
MKTSKNIKKIVLDEIKTILEKKTPPIFSSIDSKGNLFNGETGLDSLDLAELIIRLEGVLGVDPFGRGEAIRTIEELIAFYEREGI